MTDDDDDDESNQTGEIQNHETGEKYYYIKSDRTISELAFEEINS